MPATSEASPAVHSSGFLYCVRVPVRVASEYTESLGPLVLCKVGLVTAAERDAGRPLLEPLSRFAALANHYRKIGVHLRIPEQRREWAKGDVDIPIDHTGRRGRNSVSVESVEGLCDTLANAQDNGPHDEAFFDHLVALMPISARVDRANQESLESLLRLGLGGQVAESISDGLQRVVEPVLQKEFNPAGLGYTELVIAQEHVIEDLRQVWIASCLSAEVLVSRIVRANDMAAIAGGLGMRGRLSATLQWTFGDTHSMQCDIEFEDPERNRMQFS